MLKVDPITSFANIHHHQELQTYCFRFDLSRYKSQRVLVFAFLVRRCATLYRLVVESLELRPTKLI